MKTISQQNIRDQIFSEEIMFDRCNIEKCLFTAECHFDKCNLIDCSFEAQCTFEKSNVLSAADLRPNEEVEEDHPTA